MYVVYAACLYTEEDELARNKFQRLYTCTQPKYAFEVIPISNILGKLPLMPDLGTPTIPVQYTHRQKTAFPRGSADSSSTVHNGSKLYYINHFGLTWARPKLSLRR